MTRSAPSDARSGEPTGKLPPNRASPPPSGADARPRRARSSSGSTGPRRRGWHLAPYLFLAPAAVAVIIVQVGPALTGVVTSLLRLTQFTIGDWISAPFAGGHNYWIAVNVNQPAAHEFLDSLGITCAYTVVVVGASWVLGMAGAVFLSDTFHGRGLVRSLFLLPYAVPAYVGVIVWTFMFQPNGAVNTLLGRDLHLVAPDTFWLVRTSAFGSMAVTTIWRSWPFAFLMLLAGLQGIPGELYEAARVDGATRWQGFRRITLPSLRRVNLLLVLITGFWTFNDFTTSFVMFNTSPPASADLMTIQIYVNSFVDLNFGLGAAMSVVMIAFLGVFGIIYLRMLRLDRKGPQYA